MKIAYFDCPTGLSGNMILGALLDAGLSLSYLKKELRKINIKDYSLKMTNVTKNRISASHFDVVIKDKKTRRSIDEIYALIKRSRLKPQVKNLSLRIFNKLFEAESKVHGRHIHHLHETGATDAMVDIVGSAIGFDKLGIKEVYCSALPFGHGQIRCEHGLLPNPAPATFQLLKGVPVYKKNIKGELVTPTGAAIITSIAKSFTDMPKLELQRTGLGAGTFDLKEPNILRLFIGEASANFSDDLAVSIETNIDNMNPEFYGHAIGRLMKLGALDAFIMPVQMKKGRPGVKLTVFSEIKDKDKMVNAIFDETTTLGVRTFLVKREKLERKMERVRTKYGPVMVKIGTLGKKIKNISPELSDCLKLAKRTRTPLKVIYDAAKNAAVKQCSSPRTHA